MLHTIGCTSSQIDNCLIHRLRSFALADWFCMIELFDSNMISSKPIVNEEKLNFPEKVSSAFRKEIKKAHCQQRFTAFDLNFRLKKYQRNLSKFDKLSNFYSIEDFHIFIYSCDTISITRYNAIGSHTPIVHRNRNLFESNKNVFSPIVEVKFFLLSAKWILVWRSFSDAYF